MGLLQRAQSAFRGFVQKIRPSNQYSSGVGQPLSDIVTVNDFGSPRKTRPSFTMGGGGLGGSLPKFTTRQLGITESQLKTMTIDTMIDVMIDTHPDVGFALWNFLRLGNSGYSFTCSKIKSGKPYPRAEREVTALIQRLSMPNTERFELSRDFNSLLNQLILSTVTRGAAAVELVLTPGLDDVAFIAAIDPATIEFRFENNRFVPYQDKGAINLDIPTFIYEALDPRIDDPYGRSPFLNALNTVFFQMQILEDIKAVVHNQGYPRFDITVLEEILLQRMPVKIRYNEEEKAKWLNDRLDEIVKAYANLEPDEAFVHYDSVQIKTVGGERALIDPQKLMSVIDNQIMSGLKTLATLLGRRSKGDSESFAKIETKLYMTGLDAIQEVVEKVINRALMLYLNIKGIQAIVDFKFKDVDIRTELEKAQFEQIHLYNCAYKRDQGWIDQHEASMLAVGHAPVRDEPINNEPPLNKEDEVVSGTPDEKTVGSPTEQDEDV